MTWLRSFAPQILGGARILIGLNFLAHGMQKLLGFFGGAPAGMPAPMLYTAGGIELVCGGLIAAGLFTRWAAFLSSGLMAAAYFIAHAPRGLFPIENGGELSIAYCWFFLYLAAAGPGAMALDRED